MVNRKPDKASPAAVIFSLLIISIVTSIVYLPSLGNGFTNWDDIYYIHKNDSIKDIAWDNVANIFARPALKMYNPLVVFSFALNYSAGELNPFGYHLTNLIFHVLNSVLVFFLIRGLETRISIAFISALLFGVHPIHVESVAWVSERKDVLSTFFFLGGLLFYLKYLKSQKGVFYYSCLLAVVLSLLCKPIAILFPVAMILIDNCFERPFKRKVVLEKLPFLVIGFAFLVGVFFSQGIEEKWSGQSLSFIQNIFVAAGNLKFYLVKSFIPVNLSAYYPYPEDVKFFDFGTLSSLALTVFLFYWVWSIRTQKPKVFLGWMLFLIFLIPYLKLIPFGAKFIAADRYMYLPSIGLFFAVVKTGYCLYEANYRGVGFLRGTLWVVLMCSLLFYSCLTWERCKIWKNSGTLWTDVLEGNPGFSMAYYMRGRFHGEIGNYKEVIEDLSNVLKTYQDPGLILHFRGEAYLYLEDYSRALEDFNQAIKLRPSKAPLYFNRGLVFLNRNEIDLAINDFEQSLEINPEYSFALNSLGLAYYKQGKMLKAIGRYDKAIKIKEDFTKAYINRGKAYLALKQNGQAIRDFNEALDLKPEAPTVYNYRGEAYRNLKQWDRAIEDFTSAIRVRSDYKLAYLNRSLAHLMKGEKEKALEDRSRASAFKSSHGGS